MLVAFIISAVYKKDQRKAFRSLPELTAFNSIFFQEEGPPSTTLRTVTVQIINHSSCNSAYALLGGITDRMICAGVPGGGKDACQVTGSG